MTACSVDVLIFGVASHCPILAGRSSCAWWGRRRRGGRSDVTVGGQLPRHHGDFGFGDVGAIVGDWARTLRALRHDHQRRFGRVTRVCGITAGWSIEVTCGESGLPWFGHWHRKSPVPMLPVVAVGRWFAPVRHSPDGIDTVSVLVRGGVDAAKASARCRVGSRRAGNPKNEPVIELSPIGAAPVGVMDESAAKCGCGGVVTCRRWRVPPARWSRIWMGKVAARPVTADELTESTKRRVG